MTFDARFRTIACNDPLPDAREGDSQSTRKLNDLRQIRGHLYWSALRRDGLSIALQYQSTKSYRHISMLSEKPRVIVAQSWCLSQ